MIYYLDTSVLLPAIIQQHELHPKAIEILNNALRTGKVMTSATHAYAELYRTLTKGNTPFELEPAMAQETILQLLTGVVELVVLNRADYDAAVQRCVDMELKSSVIYDALHFQAALKAEAEVIYTDNLRDFNRLLQPDDPLRVDGIR